MSTRLLTLHGQEGSIGSVEINETRFVLGSETAPDVYTVAGDGVAARHTWVWIGGAGLQEGEITRAVEIQNARVAEEASHADTIPMARVQPSEPE